MLDFYIIDRLKNNKKKHKISTKLKKIKHIFNKTTRYFRCLSLQKPQQIKHFKPVD